MPIVQITGPISQPLALDRGHSVSVTPLSGSCRVQIPGEAVSETLTAAASYGPYSVRRDVVMTIDSGVVEYDVDEAGGAVGGGPTTLPALQSVFDSGTSAQKAAFQSSVSGYVATFQDLLNITLPSPGRRACVVSPVFSGGIPYTRWIYDGTAWRLDGPQDLLIDSSPSVGAASTAEQILKQTTADAGLLLALRYFIVRAVVAKSGATDAMSASRIRFGANGTTSDTPISNDTSLSAPNRQRALELPLLATSTTVLRHYTNGGGGGMAQALTSSAYPTQVPVANMLSATKFSFSAQMAGTTDTPTMVSVFIYGG